jgi:trk system potassium uptake protein TrkA
MEDDMGVQLARGLSAPNILEHITLATGHSLVEARPPERFVGRTLKELDLRRRYQVNVVAITSHEPTINEEGEVVYDKRINDLPSGDDVIRDGDTLMVVGKNESIDALVRKTDEGT